MTKKQFGEITHNALVQPKNYTEVAFNILKIDSDQGLIKINEVRYKSKSKWYRYENLDIVIYKKVIDKDTFNENESYEKI